MRISDWSSDVCSSDLIDRQPQTLLRSQQPASINLVRSCYLSGAFDPPSRSDGPSGVDRRCRAAGGPTSSYGASGASDWARRRSEEHTSELQSLMRNSYAAFCLKKQTYTTITQK